MTDLFAGAGHRVTARHRPFSRPCVLARVPVRPWLLSLALAGGACAQGGHEFHPTPWTVVHGGRDRRVHVFVPARHCPEQPVPLVLALHGGGGRGGRLDWVTEGSLTRGARARGWVVAFPEGVERRWNDGRASEDKGHWDRSEVDDVGFLLAVIALSHARLGIDVRRVYVIGISNGGFMSLRMAVDASRSIAAAAAVNAAVTVPLGRRRPSAPVPVLFMNGTEDPVVPYEGGPVKVLGQQRGAVWSTEGSVEWWRGINGCTSPPSREALPDSAEDGTRTQVERSLQCSSGAPVVLYRIEGGGHGWPGGRQYAPRSTIGRVARDFDAGHEIFEFFAHHCR